MSDHVLVVDDGSSIRDLVREALDFQECRVATASNGCEALERIAACRPGLVLLDMRMPVLDGWGVARELRERGITVPLVVMTAAENARQWCAEVGGAACLAKPFDLDDLIATVTRFVACPPPDA